MKYTFTLTGAYAMIPEFVSITQKLNDGDTIADIDEKILGREKGVTNKRQFFELQKRIKELSPLQIEILAEELISFQRSTNDGEGGATSRNNT